MLAGGIGHVRNLPKTDFQQMQDSSWFQDHALSYPYDLCVFYDKE